MDTNMTQSLTRNEEDLALLHRITEADEEALGVLYDRYGRLLFSLAVKMLRSLEEAEQIVEEVFLLVWNSASTYRNARSSVYTWIITMTRNRAVERIRAKGSKRQPTSIDITTMLLDADARKDQPGAPTAADDYRHLILGAMSQLRYEQQEIVALAYFEGYTRAAIAEKLGIPLSTVFVRMRQSLMEMRTWLEVRAS
jgi:RNA polymerase sigma-70 factor (ECF subfamily)